MSNTRQDKSRRHGSRYRARRRAVDIIFEAEARDIDPVAIVDDRIELSQQPDPPVKPVAPYTQEIVGGVAVELDRVDEVISRYLLDNWMLERLPAVDRAILRVATWELLFNPDVPVKTAVVEGVELASEYSTDAAAPYINAALDAIAGAVDDQPAVWHPGQPGRGKRVERIQHRVREHTVRGLPAKGRYQTEPAAQSTHGSPAAARGPTLEVEDR